MRGALNDEALQRKLLGFGPPLEEQKDVFSKEAHDELIRRLLDAGASVSAEDGRKATPLHDAARDATDNTALKLASGAAACLGFGSDTKGAAEVLRRQRLESSVTLADAVSYPNTV